MSRRFPLLSWHLLIALLAALSCPLDQAFSQTTALEFTYAKRYDASRRIAATIDPTPDPSGSIKFAAVRNSYDASGNLIKIEKGELSAWQSEAVAPPAWAGFTVFQTLETSFDMMNRKVVERIYASGSLESVRQYNYDDLGRLKCSAIRMNPATWSTILSDACVLGVTGTFGPDRISRNSYDTAGRLLKIEEAVGVTIANGFPQNLQQDYSRYTYTVDDKQETVVDANGNKATFYYDGFNRQIAWAFPTKANEATTASCTISPITEAGGVAGPPETRAASDDCEKYAYDANDNRAKLMKRDGSVLRYSFDALSRLITKTVPDGGLGSVSATRDVFFTYDLRGLRRSATFDSVSGADGVATEYDGFGRVTKTITSMQGTPWAVAHEYDLNGNRTKTVWPDASTFMTYQYDGLDRMAAVKQNGVMPVATMTYNARGERSAATRGDASSLYTYDGVSRLASQQDDVAGAGADVTTTFPVYNPAEQIVGMTRDNDRYSYGGYAPDTVGYAVNGLNQYTAVGTASPTYDANGNLTSIGATSYLYDVENRMLSSSAGAGLVWDALGRLYQTSTGGASATRFLYDGDELIAEYDSGGNLLRRYVHGAGEDDPILWYEGAGLSDRRALQADRAGSIVSVSGAGVSVNTYDEWGVPGRTNAGRFQFTGQAWLPELGFYHYKARLYDPALGRFLQTDPVGYDDQVNLYAYVGNDPVNGRDSTGLGDDFENPKFIPKSGEADRAGREIRAAREEGIRAAWKAERTAVENGGGSRNWSRSERAELLKTGRLSGYEGHHVNTVKGNPLAMARDPRNVQFVTRNEHVDIHRTAGGFRQTITGRPMVTRSYGFLSGLTLGTGLLSGRVRTDSFDNFVSDMIGVPSTADAIRADIERCGSPGCA